jgi:hypothetical protein
MPPPATYVMSTQATGPRHDRRPAGVIHAAPTTHPPVHTTYCGQADGLFWFGHVDFREVGDLAGERCPDCLAALAALAPPAVPAGLAPPAVPAAAIRPDPRSP